MIPTDRTTTAFLFCPRPCSSFTSLFTRQCQIHHHRSTQHLLQLPTKHPPARIKSCTPNATADSRGPSTIAPDYTSIDRNPLNALFTKIFLSKLTNELGYTPSFEIHMNTFSRVIVVIKHLAEKYRSRPSQLNKASQRVITSLFPSWLPTLFAHMFSKPFPYVAAWLNAVVTVAVTQWLMGPSSMVREQDEDNDVFTVQIERCRYLEETGCVGICLHSCKAATQDFFTANMGIPLNIEPNLDDFSCKFQFGKQTLPPHLDPMYTQPCFATCSSAIASKSPAPVDQEQEQVIPPCHAIEGREKKTECGTVM